MLIQKFLVKAYVSDGHSAEQAVQSFLQDEDWVSWSDTDLLSEEYTEATYPEYFEENNLEPEKKKSEIIPCPFCGQKDEGNGELSVAVNNTTSKRFVYCEKCRAKGPMVAEPCSDVQEEIEKAIAAWNNRSYL